MFNIKIEVHGNALEVDAIELKWRPARGQLYYTPDIRSVMLPVTEYEWTDNPTDYMLLAAGRVYRTKEEAYDSYVTIQRVLAYLFNGE